MRHAAGVTAAQGALGTADGHLARCCQAQSHGRCFRDAAPRCAAAARANNGRGGAPGRAAARAGALSSSLVTGSIVLSPHARTLRAGDAAAHAAARGEARRACVRGRDCAAAYIAAAALVRWPLPALDSCLPAQVPDWSGARVHGRGAVPAGGAAWAVGRGRRGARTRAARPGGDPDRASGALAAQRRVRGPRSCNLRGRPPLPPQTRRHFERVTTRSLRSGTR